jgi:hypothetical protein
MGYIQLPIVSDSDVITQQALANIQALIPGWVPREGNLEVLLIEQFALMAAEAATTASDVPDTIFAYYGGLVGITPLPGTYETIKATWTLVNPAVGSPGYQIPAGTVVGFYFSGAAYQFETVADYLIGTGSTSVSVTLQSVAVGSAYDLDALAGSSSLNLSTQYLTPQYSDTLVSNISITATPSTNTTLTKGTDPETTTQYLNRLTSELQLLAPRPITPSDYALFSQNVPGIYRALAIDGINPFSNLFTVANANMTLAPTSGSAPTGWTGVGDGTHNAALSTPGTSPTNQLTITTSGTALVSGAAVQAATAVGATSITITVGTGDSLSITTSPSNPVVVIITDATNGNEATVVTAAAATTGSGATTQQVWTLAAPLNFLHGVSATVQVLQGAMAPLVGAAPVSAGTVAPNSKYYVAAAVVECGTDTTGTASPRVVALATYLDGSTQVFGESLVTSPLFDYTSGAKTISVNIPVYNSVTVNNLAGVSNPPYSSLKPTLCSVQMFVVFGGAGLTKTHFVYYNNVSAVQYRFDGDDLQTLTNSYWNFVPDSNLASTVFGNSVTGSWTVPAGVVAIPQFGLQYVGTGSALGSPLTAISQIFKLPNVASDVVGTSRNYTAFATVDATYAGATFADVAIELWDMSTGAILVTAGPLNVTASPSSAGMSTLTIPLTVTAAKDVQVRVVFAAGLNIPINSSVMVSNIGVMSGTQTAAYCLANNDLGYSWTPGGLYSTQAFNYPRMISICPVDINGIGVSDALGDSLVTYLASRREVNFITNVIQPAFFPIDIQWTGYIAPGYTVAGVQSAVNTAIKNFLNPAIWGGGNNAPPSWDGSQSTIRVFDIAGIISQVQGMGSILSVKIRPSYPASGAYGTTDITMTGVAALPIANTISGTLYESSLAAYSGLS